MAKKTKAKKASKQEMLNLMYKKYGTQVKYVEVDVHMTHDEVEKYFGAPCPDYDMDCLICEGWRQFSKTGTAKVLLRRDDIIKMIND